MYVFVRAWTLSPRALRRALRPVVPGSLRQYECPRLPQLPLLRRPVPLFYRQGPAHLRQALLLPNVRPLVRTPGPPLALFVRCRLGPLLIVRDGWNCPLILSPMVLPLLLPVLTPLQSSILLLRPVLLRRGPSLSSLPR